MQQRGEDARVVWGGGRPGAGQCRHELARDRCPRRCRRRSPPPAAATSATYGACGSSSRMIAVNTRSSRWSSSRDASSERGQQLAGFCSAAQLLTRARTSGLGSRNPHSVSELDERAEQLGLRPVVLEQSVLGVRRDAWPLPRGRDPSSACWRDGCACSESGWAAASTLSRNGSRGPELLDRRGPQHAHRIGGRSRRRSASPSSVDGALGWAPSQSSAWGSSVGSVTSAAPG